MTVFDNELTRHATAVTPGALARRLTAQALGWFVTRRERAAEHRRQRLDRQAYCALLGKEDWVYRDMGVNRADVEWAARLPLHVNAARELERLRARSRMGR
ncbi:hypothetical protein [Oceaniradius stylonematis]|jgi:hypothetical protein|uniref:hypothetical protein n=1 Tax=Oceaniradius stylonematis TaxID=2184161 RepID=UPI003C7DA44B